MNKITLIGNLTADTELRTTQSGNAVCTFTLAVNRRFASSDGERQTDFFRINTWRGLAETCNKHLAKGRKVAVIGELQARTYQTRDGETRMSLDVSADEVEFLSPKEPDAATVSQCKVTPEKPTLTGFEGIDTSDLPF